MEEINLRGRNVSDNSEKCMKYVWFENFKNCKYDRMI
jgi:hypothetical protein